MKETIYEVHLAGQDHYGLWLDRIQEDGPSEHDSLDDAVSEAARCLRDFDSNWDDNPNDDPYRNAAWLLVSTIIRVVREDDKEISREIVRTMEEMQIHPAERKNK